MTKVLLKLGGGVLEGVYNSIMQPYCVVKVYVDKKLIFEHNLNELFEKRFPHVELFATFNTGRDGNSMPDNKFYERLEIETNGEISVVYK